MVFCSNCGTQTPGAFCPNCGAPASAPAAEPSGSAGPSGPAAGTSQGFSPTAPPSAAGLTDNVASALCYVLGFVTGILFLLIAPYNQNKLVRFHAFQSIFLHLGSIFLFFASLILRGHGLGFIRLIFGPLLSFALFAVWLYVVVSAFQGKKVVLPVIGELAEKQA